MAIAITLSNSTVAADAPSGTVVGVFNADGVRFQGATRPDYLLIVGRMIVTTWDVLAMAGPIPIQVHAPGGAAVSFVIVITPPASVPPPPPPPISVDGTKSAAPNGNPLVTAAGLWKWGTAAAGRPGENFVVLNGSPTVGIGALMEVAKGGLLYVNTANRGWYAWGNGGFAQTGDPTVSPPPPPPPPPPPITAIITVTPHAPNVPDTTPKGAPVASFTVSMSDRSAFSGSVTFGAPNFDAGGIFSLSALTKNPDGLVSGQILVNPAGPGVGPNLTTVTDHVTLLATP